MLICKKVQKINKKVENEFFNCDEFLFAYELVQQQLGSI